MTETFTMTEAVTVTIERERDKYGRSVTRYRGHGPVQHGAAIVRMPKAYIEKYGKDQTYMVNLDTVSGQSSIESVVHVPTLREARAMVQALPWVAGATETYDYTKR